MAEKRQRKSDAGLGTLGKLDMPTNSAARRRVAMPVISAIIILAFLWVAFRPESDTLDVYRTVAEIDIADPALQRCIRNTAESHGWNEAGQFSSLRCNNPTGGGIQRLDGIEHFVVLRDLDLAFNSITDVSALARLPRLTDLQLSHNRISNLPIFQSAPSLKRLELNYNQIDSLDWLTSEHFLVLEGLSIAHNRIEDAGPLRALSGLRELNIRSNRLLELGSILELGNLDMLDAGGNRIRDVTGIDALSALRRLFLDKNQLVHTDAMQTLRDLEQLDIGYNPITSIEALGGLSRLQRLDLRYTAIEELDSLLSLGDLEQLDLYGTAGLDCNAIAKAIKEFGKSAVLFDQECPAAGL
jgi:Leucine-rich repeat (LRR) protein